MFLSVLLTYLNRLSPSRNKHRPQRLSFRALLCLPPLALVAGALYLLPRADLAQLNREAVTDPWPLSALDQSAGQEIGLAERLTEAKRQVTRSLIDGHLTFQQAAAQFQAINAGLPDKGRRWRPLLYTEEEWPYRQVIFFVHYELTYHRRAPAQAEVWVARLEAELREYLRRDAAPTRRVATRGRKGLPAESSPPRKTPAGPESSWGTVHALRRVT
jgi:hypothetical protein